MFTGIIETIGKVEKIEKSGTNIDIYILSLLNNNLELGQSIAHDGVCLTVAGFDGILYKVTAVEETLNKTNLKYLKEGSELNIERCMPANGRFDGHIVQGHVDTVATCIDIIDLKGSWKFVFEYQNETNITVEKGSITINGTSLTVVDSLPNQFSVVIIPHTFAHTNFKNISVGSIVNLEFDIVGKYIQKILKGK